MTEKANTVFEGLMRAGYGARGSVYLLVGAIAMFAAVNGGEAKGSTGALNFLVRQTFGQVMLAIVALGLFAYTAWRFTDALLDLENEGDDAEGTISRAGQFISGVTHAFLGVSAVTILIKGAQVSSGNGNTAENWSAMVMSQPFGQWLVGIAGATTVAVGIYLFIKAKRTKYKADIRNTPTTEKLAPFVRFGLFAHGVVLLLIGGLIIFAAVSANPERAAGLGEALQILEQQTYGRIILGVIGAGLASFAVYCGVRAVFGIAPRVNRGSTLET
ncbi:MAG: DUF1206 domain-containing protein [Pseudomonadota bacterium]